MNRIYFDNAATSWPKPPAMMAAMNAFNDTVGANPGRSAHRSSIDAGRTLLGAREAVCRAIGADDPLRIAFTKNATEALNIAIMGLLKPGDHVITTSIEHNSVMRPLRHLEQNGVELTVAPCSPAGELDPEILRSFFRKNTRLVVVTHASNVTGTILPVSEIVKIANENGALACVDAAQTAGCLPIDVSADGTDILCFTGHKALLGPQGTGGLYVRKGVEELIAPLMRGGTGSRSEFEEQPGFMPDRFEAGTPNAIGLAGLLAGIGHVLDMGIVRIREHDMRMTGLFLEGLRGIPGVRPCGPGDPARMTSTVSFTIRGMSPSDAALELDERFGILSRPGLQCCPAAHRTIGTFPEGTVRFSFGMFTTEEEVRRGVEAVAILSKEAGN